jgi:hypothetical protein
LLFLQYPDTYRNKKGIEGVLGNFKGLFGTVLVALVGVRPLAKEFA